MAQQYQKTWVLKDVYKMRVGGDWPVYQPPNTNQLGWFAGGETNPGSVSNVIDRINFASDTSNAVDRADLVTNQYAYAGATNGTHGWWGGGSTPSAVTNIVQRITFASDTANALDRCDLTVARDELSSVSNISYGWWGGGFDQGSTSYNIVDRIDFSSDTTNAVDRCDLTSSRKYLTAASNGTNGWFAGGQTNPAVSNTKVNIIDRIVFATDTTNATDRSDLSVSRGELASYSNGTDSYWLGGLNATPGVAVNIIDRTTYSTDTTNASDRCDLTSAKRRMAGVADGTYGWCGGGLDPSASPPPYTNVVERITFASDTSNSIDRCDLTLARGNLGSLINSYGTF